MSGSNQLYNTQSTAVSNGNQPSNGKVYNFILTLIGAPVSFDLKPLVNQNRIGDVQGIFADNSAGTQTLTISTAVGQNIKIPAGYQGVLPLYLSADKVITFVGYGVCPIVLLNFATPASIWSATGAGSVTISGTVNVDVLQLPNPNQTTPINPASFSIVTGGTAQNAFAASSIINQGIILNPNNATESLFVDLVNTAQAVQGGGTNGTSFELLAGQTFFCPPSSKAVSVIAATTGHTFVATSF